MSNKGIVFFISLIIFYINVGIVTAMVEIPQGRYVIIPFTNESNVCMKYSLRIYCDNGINKS